MLNAYTSRLDSPTGGPSTFFSSYGKAAAQSDLELREQERRHHLLQQRLLHVHPPPHLLQRVALVPLEQQQHDRLQRQHLQRDGSLSERHLQRDEAAHEGPAEGAFGVDGEAAEGVCERLEGRWEADGGGLVEVFELGLRQRRPDALGEDVESEGEGDVRLLLVERAVELSA